MRDIYTESVIPVTPPFIYKLLRILLLILTALAAFAGLFIELRLLILAALFGFLLYRVSQKADGELEYIHTNDVFDVDLVVRASARKHLLSVDLGQVLLVAPVDDPELDAYRGIPETDHSGDDVGGRLYAMVYAKDGRQRKLLLQMDEKMRRSLKQWLPGKVH